MRRSWWEKRHQESLQKHFRLTSSSWVPSFEVEGVHQFGGDFFFVPSTVIQKALIQETGLAFPELLLTAGFHASLWQGVSWLSQEQNHGWCEEKQTLTTDSGMQFLSMSNSMTPKEEIW